MHRKKRKEMICVYRRRFSQANCSAVSEQINPTGRPGKMQQDEIKWFCHQCILVLSVKYCDTLKAKPICVIGRRTWGESQNDSSISCFTSGSARSRNMNDRNPVPIQTGWLSLSRVTEWGTGFNKALALYIYMYIYVYITYYSPWQNSHCILFVLFF